MESSLLGNLRYYLTLEGEKAHIDHDAIWYEEILILGFLYQNPSTLGSIQREVTEDAKGWLQVLMQRV